MGYSRGPSGDKLNQTMRSHSPAVTWAFPSQARGSKAASSRATGIPDLSIEDTAQDPSIAARNSYPTTEDEQEPYFPSHQRKKKSVLHKRPKTTSVSSAVSSDTDGEEYNWTNDKSILESNAALIEAKLKRKEDDEKARQDEHEKHEQEEAIRKAVEEQLEKEAKEQEQKDRIKAEEDNKRKIAAEKLKAELEAKKKAAEEKKKLEEEEKKKAIEEKRKVDAEAKKKALEEKKRLEEEKT